MTNSPLVREIKVYREQLARLQGMPRKTAADRSQCFLLAAKLAGMEYAATLTLDMADLADLHRHARGES